MAVPAYRSESKRAVVSVMHHLERNDVDKMRLSSLALYSNRFDRVVAV